MAWRASMALIGEAACATEPVRGSFQPFCPCIVLRPSDLASGIPPCKCCVTCNFHANLTSWYSVMAPAVAGARQRIEMAGDGESEMNLAQSSGGPEARASNLLINRDALRPLSRRYTE